MTAFPNHYAINFYLWLEPKLFARRILSNVPTMGDFIIFNGVRYNIVKVEWCLDEDATNYEYQALINVELQPNRPQINLKQLKALP